jgi:hypothetical protein
MANAFRARWWQVGRLLPWLMAILFVCDIVGRFMPLELVAFRTFEPALRTTPGGPGEFEPYKIVRMRRAYGDLAAMSNTWHLRQYHDEEFHVDLFGNRNGYSVFDANYAGIVTGDSFSVASGVAEADTLSGRLTKIAGARFYNAGNARTLFPDEDIYLASLLKLHSGVIVLEVLERVCKTGPPIITNTTPVWDTSPKKVEQKLGATEFLPWLTQVQAKLSPMALSPMQIVAQKVIKRFQNGKLRPNPYWSLVVHERLRNGDDMLFYPGDLIPTADPQGMATSWVRYLEWYDRKLKPHNLKLVVLLVPDKYTVYGPLSTRSAQPSAGGTLLADIAEQLQAKDIAVVNLTEEFKTKAAQELPYRRYLYWRDDTHWSSEGISIAADALRKYIAPDH